MAQLQKAKRAAKTKARAAAKSQALATVRASATAGAAPAGDSPAGDLAGEVSDEEGEGGLPLEDSDPTTFLRTRCTRSSIQSPSSVVTAMKTPMKRSSHSRAV